MQSIMGDVINLRQARKVKARSLSEAKAASNRRIHGRTKAEKQMTEKEWERSSRLLDGARLDQE